MIDFENLISSATSGLGRRSAPRADGGQRLRRVGGFGVNPGALDMWLYTPVGLAGDAPLVVVLHGCGQSAQEYAAGAGWLTLADRHGFAVLAPEQTAANNANRCFNWFEPGDVARGAGEAASIRAMIGKAVADHGLDQTRVFVTGLSAGGAMTAVMLATYPEVFAAGAVVAGLPYGAATNVQEAFGAMFQGRSRPAGEWGGLVRGASTHVSPWPRVSIWHGQGDTTVKPGAGEELARQWTNVHGLSTPATEARSANGRPYLVWRSPAGEPLVELHRLAGMGHGTPLATGGPDGCGAAGPFLLDVGVSSSREIGQAWGIVPQGAAETVSQAPRSQPQPQTFERAARGFNPEALTARLGGVDVADTISKALRAAGLMK